MLQNSDLLEIYTLGRIAIQWRTQAEPLPIAPREAAFLIYLAYHRVPLRRSHLYTLFWPNEPTVRAQGNLRKLLLDLRKNIGVLLTADRETVGLHQDLNYWLDVHEFQWQMQPLEHVTPPQPERHAINIPRLQRGIQLYRGEFLGDLKLPKSHTFCTWLEQEQQALHQQMINALKCLLEESKQKKRYTEALDYTKRIVELDPFEEDAHEQMMVLLAQLGCIAEALQHYQHYAQFLKEEIASEPELHLVTLYQKIRSGFMPTQETERKLAPVQPNKRTTKQLPKPLTPLLGRTEILQQLQRYLTDPTVRLVTLTGMGGVGKTHLALTMVEQLTLHFDQIVLLSLHELTQSGLQQGEASAGTVSNSLAQATAAALQLPLTANDSFLSQLSAYLQQQQLLLLFDGFETVVAGAHFLASLLQEVPLLKVLVTSRECLQLPGESILHLEGLAVPTAAEKSVVISDRTQWPGMLTSMGKDCTVNDCRVNDGGVKDALLPRSAGYLSESTKCQNNRVQDYVVQDYLGQDYIEVEQMAPSLQLFLHCLQRQSPQFALQPESLQYISQICHLVEGNPLAIELAAGLSFHYSWQEVVERLQHDLAILATAQRGRPQRHRSMNTVLTASWHLLTPPEQATLVGLSRFTGSFTRHEAITATGSTPQILMALVNKSLVRSKGAGLYELPRLIRLFVQAPPS